MSSVIIKIHKSMPYLPYTGCFGGKSLIFSRRKVIFNKGDYTEKKVPPYSCILNCRFCTLLMELRVYSLSFCLLYQRMPESCQRYTHGCCGINKRVCWILSQDHKILPSSHNTIVHFECFAPIMFPSLN